MTLKRKITESQIRSLITDEMKAAATTVLIAKAHLQVVKPIVEAYSTEILARHKFTNKGEIARLGNRFAIEEKVITNMDLSYKMSDEDFLVYHTECKEARDKSGLKVDDPDHCPMLVAESMLATAEGVLIDAMAPITGFDSDASGLWVDGNRAKAVEVTLGLLGSLGMLQNPLKRL